jgi:hypothetical protein
VSYDNFFESVAESNAIVQRLFEVAAQRAGSASALGEHLGLNYAQLQPYLAGKAIPPTDVILRAADLVVEELKIVRSGFSEHAWRSLSLPSAGPNR